ncbi:hypothetical protein L917_12387 [Phytophthora nicotianae]|uniref:WLGC domain-containing protein n=1 Tax=Phytophthora nicotianae TaxID=4792 RepID=W2KTU7_PHYNI|nr:hypothetical protein L915_12636 [Phytophthora nicotianae]ETL88537.1 hypothetical protein L917_12387 [Phytophthora nicotianae]
MTLILVLCFVWTGWLIVVSLAPNEAANWLMDTGTYDNGQFWLIIDANPELTRMGVAGLLFVALCYMFVLLKMICWREKIFIPVFLRQLEARLLDSLSASRLESRTWSVVVAPSYQQIHSSWKDHTSFNGKKRKLWNVYTKVVDLVMQTIVLFELLKRGSPVPIVYGYTCFVVMNSLSCAVNIFSAKVSTLTEVLIDTIFDLSAAVLFPIITLVFCYYNFEFDRDVYLSQLDKLISGSFEHTARMFADQSEIALFRVSFDSLRFSSGLDLVVRIALNLSFCYRIKRMMEVMIWRRRHSWISGRTRRKSSGTIIPLEHKSPVPKFVGALFLLYNVAMVVITQQSIAHSVAACSAYPECVVYAYHWTSSDIACPCLIFIDINKAPKTYEEWVHPPNAYSTLRALSVTGRLESVQIINRELSELPKELRSCHNLRTLQLMYTNTQNLPDWTGEFNHLETFHIEGKAGSMNLRELPDTLFSNMPHLAMIHLAVHGRLERIPPLSGVPHLQSLSLAWMLQLRQLPDFDLIPDLRMLAISVVPLLEWIPDMSPLDKLVDFTMMPGIICCNGFLGACDLADFFCLGDPFLGLPPAKCLMNATNSSLPVTPYLGYNGTQDAFKKYAPNVCAKWTVGAVYIDNTPTKEKVEMCDGKLFRKCHLPGNVTGICSNMRFQVLSCVYDDSRIALRQYQIDKGIGPLCDPVEEKWLGCRER